MPLDVLITGSSGFIGSRLAIRCNEAGMNVIATSRTINKKIELDIGLPLKKLDVLSTDLQYQEIEAEVILHTATANEFVSKDFIAGINLSVIGTRNILELAVRQGIRKVIFFSTVQVYGTEMNGEISEKSSVCCESSYALNHFMGEEVCRMFALKHGIDVVILRPSNVYGVPDTQMINRPPLVPMSFVKEAKEEEKLKIRSSGLQRRNFISNDEVADYCIELLNNFPNGCEVINIVSNFTSSIKEVAEMTAKIFYQRMGKKLKIDFLSNEPLQSNNFILKTKLDSLKPTVKESKKKFEEIIWKLFINEQERTNIKNGQG